MKSKTLVIKSGAIMEIINIITIPNNKPHLCRSSKRRKGSWITSLRSDDLQ